MEEVSLVAQMKQGGRVVQEGDTEDPSKGHSTGKGEDITEKYAGDEFHRSLCLNGFSGKQIVSVQE